MAGAGAGAAGAAGEAGALGTGRGAVTSLVTVLKPVRFCSNVRKSAGIGSGKYSRCYVKQYCRDYHGSQ